MKLIYAQRERLGATDEATGECLLRSALQANFEVEAWLKFVGCTHVQLLLTLLKEAREYDQHLALVRHLGACYAMPVLTALGYHDNDVRRRAAAALGRLGDARAVEPLIAALKSDDEAVREAAAYGLRTIGTQEALVALGDRGFALS